MKEKNIVLAAVICVIALVIVGYEHNNIKRGDKHIQEVATEQRNILLKVEELTEEIEGLKTDLNTFKLSDKDYTREIQEIMQKQAELRSVKDDVKQQSVPRHTSEGPRIAVISIRKIFQECKRGASYREEAIAEQNRIIAELEKLSKEIEAEREGLKTLKENSGDYMTSAKGLFEKQANYQARQEFYKQQMEMKDQLWTRALYQDIMRIAGEIAKEKGLDLVFKEDEVDFSEPDISELGMAIRTQKLLYSGGCLDITDEVISHLDAGK